VNDGTEHRGRKRGGQPGNTNALKHGFYSQHFKAAEAMDLEGFPQESLQDEVAMLRVMIRRVVELASNPEDSYSTDHRGDLENAITALDTLGTAATRLARLLSTEKKLAAQNGKVSDVLHQALGDIISELKGSNP
jgi:hypothetical protein